MSRTRRVMVTGGAGLMGSHLCHPPLSEGLGRTAAWFRSALAESA